MKSPPKNRVKTYSISHKGVRNALSQLSLQAGRLNCADPVKVDKLCRLVEDVFALLSDHLEGENEITLAELELKSKGCSTYDRNEHKELSFLQQQLRGLSKRMRNGSSLEEKAEEFHLSLSEFQGSYLLHLAQEERVTQVLLWDFFTDEELLQQQTRLMRRRSPEILATWFRFTIPAQNARVRKLFLENLKHLDVTCLCQAKDALRRILTKSEFDKLF
jgi:hypothetical protein